MPPTRNQGIIRDLKLNGQNREEFNHMEIVSVANINAGYTLIPCPNGYKIRVNDFSMTAIGGAASGATDVRLLATQNAASVALGVAAIAGLTQNTQNRSGSAAIPVLAGGASYALNDRNTDITVGKTGGALATATGVMFQVSYSIEKA